ncbi:ABC transporter ATP-binding protein [Paraliobacillus salinarum]|uniref:ABC transporter ATP-binding protein n=1 Tax=Paraliobacillus salinarum TaxID=1158996 RepID=UPI0015F5CB0A|nr:ABC transporter ATP-binding protein [Paraliobacillus salinarum]
MGELVATNITKSFDSKKILDRLFFTVKEGEFVTILGPSGSGKSTLFHLIGGMLQPDDGTFTLNQEEITGRRGAISYTPQSPSLLPWRTVLKNVVLGSEIKGEVDFNQAKHMLEKAGLSGYEDAYPHQLSGGMRQRVAFVRALLSPQDFICLDEPFSALDEFTRLEMQQWLLKIWEEHRKSILFVTHNIEEALYLSDRILILSKKPATIVEEYTLPFARPRDQDLFLTDEFLQWKREIYQALQGNLN